MTPMARGIASLGRGKDSQLVHMTPREVAGLQSLALAHGGSLTINPHTGLPEAGFLDSVLPMLAGALLAPMTAGTSLAFLAATPMATALTVGGITGLATGSLQKGLMAGLGAYGGAGMAANMAGNAAAAGATRLGALTDAQLTAANAATNASQIGQTMGGNIASTAAQGAQGASGALGAAGTPFAMPQVATDVASKAANARLTGMPPGAVAPVTQMPGTGLSSLPASVNRGFPGADIIKPGVPEIGSGLGNASGAAAQRASYTPYIQGQAADVMAASPAQTAPVSDFGASPQPFSNIGTFPSGSQVAADIPYNVPPQGTLNKITNFGQPNVNLNNPPIEDRAFSATTTKAPDPFAREELLGSGSSVPAGPMSRGVNAIENMYNSITDPEKRKQFLKDNWKYLAAMGLSSLGDQPTSVNAPRPKSLIRPYTYTRTPTGVDTRGPMGTSERRYFNEQMIAGKPYAAPGPEYAAKGGLMSLAIGGPVEAMSARNAVSGNTTYPTAEIMSPMYSNPMSQRPMAQSVINATGDTMTNPYTGEQKFADGGYTGPQYGPYGQYLDESGTAQAWYMDPKTKDDPLAIRARTDAGVTLPTTKTAGGSTDAGMNGLWNTNYEYDYDPNTGVLTPKMNMGEKIDTAAEIQDMYQKYFGREADVGGSEYYMGKNLTAGDLASDFQQSEEYKRLNAPKAATPEEISGMYSQYMHRAADPEGLNYYADSGMTKEDILKQLRASPEYMENLSTPLSQRVTYSPEGRASISKAPAYRTPEQQMGIPEDFYSSLSNQLAARGGYAGGGGISSLGSYSDGGHLLRGPGDGVSDSIPARIGEHQPARLADGEFVVPARIVSELGNGSTEAGAKRLYAMMDRVQKARNKTVGKGKVAVNSRADKFLPA